ncbi:MAG: TonB-system energizer ExbB [Pseudomonadota bacterium]
MEWLKVAVDYGIIGLLMVLSVVSIGIAIERYLLYRQIELSRFSNKTALEIELTNKLNIIATIGSNAPYIGLLGTVLGIMLTFYAIGNEGAMDPGKVMIGLALALKATAVGIVVAIPSVVLYNILLRRAKVLLMQWDMEYGRKGI